MASGAAVRRRNILLATMSWPGLSVGEVMAVGVVEASVVEDVSNRQTTDGAARTAERPSSKLSGRLRCRGRRDWSHAWTCRSAHDPRRLYTAVIICGTNSYTPTTAQEHKLRCSAFLRQLSTQLVRLVLLEFCGSTMQGFCRLNGHGKPESP